MPLYLSSVGEEIVAGLLESAALSGSLDSVLVRGPSEIPLSDFLGRAGLGPPFVFATEVPLEPVEIPQEGRIRFDGQHRVDVVCHSAGGGAVGAELKLGETRLSKGQFESRFLKCTDLSKHPEPRIKGSMAAVLDRRGVLARQGVRLQVKIRQYEAKTLAAEWLLIVRRRIAVSWDRNLPALTSGSILLLEDLVMAAGGSACFNRIVRDTVCRRDYSDWIDLE